ncbi:hypothetical protein PR048_002814 [Dryococelus australis]|uniref:Uncharacterized protein n=1 Tax=Dryococelus australis TaxID=614101 RepID=A0ABQ9IL93_9NEOP|nr:hypothetical protein PR048_002814 [Dryococelus australis]
MSAEHPVGYNDGDDTPVRPKRNKSSIPFPDLILPILKSSKRVSRLPCEISFVAPAYLPVKEPPLPDIDPVDRNIMLSVGSLEDEYLEELKWLYKSLSEDSGSNISCAFKQGLFVVQKSENVFSGIGLEQAHEQNNDVIKDDGGAVSLLTDPEALRRWMLGGPEITQLIAEFEESNTRIKETLYMHREQTPGFQNMFAQKEHIKSDCAKLGAKRVHIVWGTYDKESTKSYARHMRVVGERRHITRKGLFPLNWATFLKNADNKTERFAMLAEDITTYPALGNVTMWSTKGSDVLSNNINLDKAALAPSNHEVADSRIFVHVLDAVASGRTNICIGTVDTDVVVLGVSFFHELREQGLKKMWIQFGAGPPEGSRRKTPRTPALGSTQGNQSMLLFINPENQNTTLTWSHRHFND